MQTAEKQLFINDAEDKGQGVFTSQAIAAGELVVHMTGFIVPTHKLRADYMALQIDDDMWLCSKGGRVDDIINHSCRANTGFTDGGLRLFALRDIAAGDEITFDYSTSLTDEEWSLDCLCSEESCRKEVLPFQSNGPAWRKRNMRLALDYIRKRYARDEMRNDYVRQA